MEVRELICINCPLGCPLKVELDEEGNVKTVSGNTCKRGEEYGRREVTSPTRTVTSTVRVTGGREPVVPVRTKTDIPKGKIFACMEAVRKAAVKAPVRMGDVVIPNVAGTGVDAIATKDVAASEAP